MKIREVELLEIHLRLLERFEISTGGSDERRILLLRMESEDGEIWSECVAGDAPNYSYETPDTAWHVLTEYVLPSVVGIDFPDPDSALDPVSWIRGHPMALATVEMGTWGLEAVRRGVSLAKLLGGTRTEVPVGVSVGLKGTDGELLAQVEERLAQGYKKLDGLNLMMVEQPLGFDDLRDHALLQAQMETPICLDESIRGPGDTRLALELGSGKIINVKPGRVGGFDSSRKIHDLCAEKNVPVWCGGMLEAGVGRAYNLALASLPNFLLPGDISESRRYWAEDIVEPEFLMDDGMMPVPSGPGIGVTLRRDRVESLTARRWATKG
jgi:O-succinylbenzoate synthase